MSDFRVHGVQGMPRCKSVTNVDHFEVEEGGVLVFYEIPDHDDGQDVKLVEMAESEGRAVEAFNNWDYVEEK